ncbi:MAG: hypothetical protein MUF19_01585 [Candidatus Pacebacteria bacterium]|jgi:hypothetical protein|nr:hypothetical protein [Candidatus Paceibacterota bacterium]
MKDFIRSYQRYLVLALGILGFLALIVLPPLLFAPDIKDKDFPHSGEIVRVTETGFVLGNKRKDRELVVTLTSSTTVRGVIAEGAFFQVFGELTGPGQITANHVQAIAGPRKKEDRDR